MRDADKRWLLNQGHPLLVNPPFARIHVVRVCKRNYEWPQNKTLSTPIWGLIKTSMSLRMLWCIKEESVWMGDGTDCFTASAQPLWGRSADGANSNGWRQQGDHAREGQQPLQQIQTDHPGVPQRRPHQVHQVEGWVFIENPWFTMRITRFYPMGFYWK